MPDLKEIKVEEPIPQESEQKKIQDERAEAEERLKESVEQARSLKWGESPEEDKEPEGKEPKDEKPKKSFEEKLVELDVDELIELGKELREKREKEFSPSVIKNELAIIRMLVDQALNIHCQIESKAEEVQNDKRLSSHGKNEEMEKLAETSNGARDELRKQAAKLNEITEAVETEISRQACIDEGRFDCKPGSRNEEKVYANFSELKMGRLRDDFKLFGTIDKPDKNGKVETVYKFGWLLQKYINACSRGDTVTQFFSESMLPIIEDAMSYRSASDKDGIARAKLGELIKRQRASRIDPELLEFSEKINYQHRKIRHLHTLARKGFRHYDAGPREKYFQHMRRNWS
ncbi:MAG: hypothetical protein ACMUHX_04750 [bacterium]